MLAYGNVLGQPERGDIAHWSHHRAIAVFAASGGSALAGDCELLRRIVSRTAWAVAGGGGGGRGVGAAPGMGGVYVAAGRSPMWWVT